MDYVIGAVRILLGGVLLLAGISKARDRQRFREALDDFGIVPRVLRPSLSFVIPAVEITVGALVAAGVVYKAATLAATGMIAALTAALAVRLVNGGDSGCACFGALSSDRVGPATLLRNVALTACAALVYFAGPGALAITTPGSP